MTDEQSGWSDEVRRRLTAWGRWAKTGEGHGTQNILAAMVQRVAGLARGDDCSVPRELTHELEITEKAVARLTGRLRRILKATYLDDRLTFEIANHYRMGEDVVKMLLWRAESEVGRHITDLEKTIDRRLRVS